MAAKVKATFPQTGLAAQAAGNIAKQAQAAGKPAQVQVHRNEPGRTDSPYRYSDWRNW